MFGTPFYGHNLVGGNPITTINEIVVVAIIEGNISMPSNKSLLHENDVQWIKSSSVNKIYMKVAIINKPFLLYHRLFVSTYWIF